jgi:hypothetical protein
MALTSFIMRLASGWHLADLMGNRVEYLILLDV